MPSHKLIKLLAILACQVFDVPLLAQALPENTTLSTGSVLVNPPYGIQPAAMQAALAAPNATGSFSFQSFNLTSDSLDKTVPWGFNLSVCADVPVGTEPASDMVVTSSVLAIIPPSPDAIPGLFSSPPNPWQFCIAIFTGLNDSATATGQHDDGSCLQAIGSECITEILDSFDPGNCMAYDNSRMSASCSNILMPDGSFAEMS